MLAGALTRASGCWSAGQVQGSLLRGFPRLEPPSDGRASNRLVAEDAAAVAEPLRRRLTKNFAMRDDRGRAAEPARLFDASPRNALMVSFLDAAFDDALFVYVYRDPAASLAESLAIWRAGDAVTYPQLADWDGPPWCFPLVPGWEELRGRELPEIVVEQWIRTVAPMLDDLEALPPGRWCVTDHASLRADRAAELERLFGFLGLPWDAGRILGEPFAGPWELGLADERSLRREVSPYLGRTAALAERAVDWIAPRAA